MVRSYLVLEMKFIHPQQFENIYKPKLELEKLYSIMDSTNVSFNLIKKN